MSVRTEKQLRNMLNELKKRDKDHTSPNMGYEIAGAVEALEYALKETDGCAAGLR